MIKLIGGAALLWALSMPLLAQDMNAPMPGPTGQAEADSAAHYAWADVLRVDPVYAQVQVPTQNCYNQTVVQQQPGHSGIGTVLGAVVGGVIGNTIGHGGGRSLATVVGAVGGGVAGNKLGGQGSQTETNRTVCQQGVATTSDQRIVGYDVQYRYHGDVYVSRLSYDPGERLRIRVSVGPAN